jgi:parallel beta-helix repeat protein
VRHNYFHHLGGRGRWGWGTQAVYLDDCASGTTIYGNVFFKAGRAIAIGGGRDNIVENNVFIDCNPAVHVDARALGWAKERVLKRQGSWDLVGKLEKMKYDKPPYSTRYPKLAKILEGDPKVPAGNVIARNVCVRGKWLDLKGVKKEWLTLEDNLETKDPRFEDEKKQDFRFERNSPAWKTGFKRIPFDRIGIQKDEYRKDG